MPPKRKVRPQDKITSKIYEKLFDKNISTNREQEIRQQFEEYVLGEFRANNKNEDISVALLTNDKEKVHWRQNEHFTKTFHFEIKHCEDYYSLTKGEKHFLLDLAEYSKWESNILVDEFDIPLKQKQLAECIGVSTKTVWQNMKSLEEKKLVYIIEIENSVYYIVNPFLIYKGQHINLKLPQLFTDMGYVDSSYINSNGRSDRKEKQKNRITVG